MQRESSSRKSPRWKAVACLLAACIASICASPAGAQVEAFYTRRYPYVFIHSMGGYLPQYPWTNELRDYLGRFETIWVGNELAIPRGWADSLHAAGSRLLFYEFFPAIHFLAGIDTASTAEAWKTQFLNDHKIDFWTINPLVPPGYTRFAPGRHFADLPYAYDYFINYGKAEAEDYLIARYRDQKRTAWGYQGIFFDLVGSYWMNIAQIQDPNNAAQWINALSQYQALSATRDNPALSYDEAGAAFLLRLRGDASPVEFPIWGNQAYLSGNTQTGANPYYRAIDVDLLESSFTTWYNPSGYRNGVRVRIDGVWHENASPVETAVTPFFTGVAALQPMITQSAYARQHYGHEVNGVVVNYLRPAYRPIAGGYEAVVDREAIYYSYAAGLATGLLSYNWDFFDTVSNVRGIGNGPATTGIPLQGYFKWSRDDIYFLELGSYADEGYEVLNLGGGRRAVLRFFEHGFVIINAAQPARDITVDLSAHPRLKGASHGVHKYLDHFDATYRDEAEKVFTVPAAHYALGNVNTNSARVYSYAEAHGYPVGGHETSASRWTFFE